MAGPSEECALHTAVRPSGGPFCRSGVLGKRFFAQAAQKGPDARRGNAADGAFSLSRRLLKKVQMQGGALMPERGVLHVRRNEWHGGPTPQMGLFQQPAVRYSTADFHIR